MRTQPPPASGTPGRHRHGPMLLVALLTIAVAGCGGRRYEPSQAGRPYPEELGQGSVIAVQVFRDAGDLIIVNASPQSFEELDVWVNRRYMLQLDSLAAGETRRVWFGDFFDQWGETPVAGGFFRTEAPTPSVIVQLQIDETSPLLGTVAIPDEDRF
ncbi:MAG: hypothetical protein P8J88_09105 [Phycisphaerales bacterium]|nr:hypothetical protein [Phycisphaerales bacterium]MDG2133631.1 hypothetical protein [Phycisphaerales bacterium]